MVSEKNHPQNWEFDGSIINTVREPLIVLNQDLRGKIIVVDQFTLKKVK